MGYKSKQLFRNCNLIVFALALALTACSPQPHEIKLPIDGRLTVTEVEAIGGKLTDTERALFKRWSERMNRGESFGGEGSAPTVRQALLNQQTFDIKQADLVAQEQAIVTAKKERELAEQRKIVAAFEHRQAVNDEVRKYIDATIPIYRPKTFYDRYDQPISGQIEFDIKLTNHAPRSLIGIAGFVTIRDVFGRNLGSYPFALEPRVGSGQTIIQTTTLNFDPRNEQHQVLWRTKNITSEWFFESVAFEDGTRIDSGTVNRAANSGAPAKAAGKGPNT